MYIDDINRVKYIGYNGGMINIEDKIFKNFENIKDDVHGEFGKVWQSEQHFLTHIEKRKRLKHITGKADYIQKTLDCLAESKEFIFAEHLNSWDNVCYNDKKDWAVVFNEHGNIMTSYKVENEYTGFSAQHKSKGAKIIKGVPNEKFRKYFNSIRK